MRESEEILAVLRAIEGMLQRIEVAVCKPLVVCKAGELGEIVPVTVGWGTIRWDEAGISPMPRMVDKAGGLGDPDCEHGRPKVGACVECGRRPVDDRDSDHPDLAPELRSDSMGAPRSRPWWR